MRLRWLHRLLHWLLSAAVLTACGGQSGETDAASSATPDVDARADAGSDGAGGRSGADGSDDDAPGGAPNDAAEGGTSSSDAGMPGSTTDGGSSTGDGGDAGDAGTDGTDAGATPLAPGTIVDAGPGSLPAPDGGSLGTVTQCPTTQPSEPVNVLCGPTGQLQLECTYGDVTCKCNGIEWYCVRDDGCSVIPRPQYACESPGQRCAHENDIECLCLPDAQTWYCAGPTGCSVLSGNYDCDPTLTLQCDYHDGRRCRCAAADDWQCVPQACGFDPTQGRPCADAPSEGCANEAGDVCWCDDSSDTWDCYENGCLGPVAQGSQCDLFNPITETLVCEYPDRICTCMPNPPLSLWFCNPR